MLAPQARTPPVLKGRLSHKDVFVFPAGFGSDQVARSGLKQWHMTAAGLAKTWPTVQVRASRFTGNAQDMRVPPKPSDAKRLKPKAQLGWYMHPQQSPCQCRLPESSKNKQQQPGISSTGEQEHRKCQLECSVVGIFVYTAGLEALEARSRICQAGT